MRHTLRSLPALLPALLPTSLACLCVFGVAAAVAADGDGSRVYPGYQSRGAYASLLVIEADLGQVLEEVDAEAPRAPASLTKMMTALLLLEAVERGEASFQDTVEVSWDASKIGGSSAGLYSHERLLLEDAARSLMISSGNDAAIAIANHLAGSRSVFVLRMNRRARDLGMLATRYVSSHGLDGWAGESVTTAKDQARLARELLRHPRILEFSSAATATSRGIPIRNTNKLLGRFPGMDGLKTGYTGKAGFCLVATAKQGDLRLISIVLGAPNSDARFAETEAALLRAFTRFEARDVFVAGDRLAPDLFTGGTPDSIPVVIDRPVRLILRRGEPRRFVYRVRFHALSLPVTEGQQVGDVAIFLGDSLVQRAGVLAGDRAAALPWWRRLWRSLRLR